MIELSLSSRSRSIVVMEANITLNNTQISLEDSDGVMHTASDGVSRLRYLHRNVQLLLYYWCFSALGKWVFPASDILVKADYSQFCRLCSRRRSRNELFQVASFTIMRRMRNLA